MVIKLDAMRILQGRPARMLTRDLFAVVNLLVTCAYEVCFQRRLFVCLFVI